jgi:hypothetical protein
VYVALASWYGATGTRSITEDEPPRPTGWRRCLTPAIDRLDGYVVAGLERLGLAHNLYRVSPETQLARRAPRSQEAAAR